MKNTLTIVIALLLAFCGSVCGQPAGTLDLTFNTTGKVVYDKDLTDVYWDVKVQTDGKIVAVGSSMGSSYMPYIEVSRLLTDGSFDPGFGTNGHFNMNPKSESGAYKCLIRDNGKILVCGYSTDYTQYGMLIFQLNENGVLDSTFGDHGVVYQVIGSGENIAYAMTLQKDGKILVAGYTQNIDFKNVPVIIRFSETGILDATFGIGGIAEVPVTESDNDFSAVSIQSDGKILAAGHISNGMSWYSLLIARFDSTGSLDAGYGTGGIVNLNLNNVDDEFYDLQLTGNDDAVLTGFTVSQADLFYHLLVMKFDNAGQPVTGFGDNGKVIFGDVPYTFGDAMAIQPNGKILVSGCTGDLMPANNDWALWRFNQDGSADNSFGTNGLVTTDFFGNADEALGIALYADKIILAGKTRNADNMLDFAVARYTNDVDVAVGQIPGLQKFSVSPNPVKHGETVNLVYELKQDESISIGLISNTGISVMEISLGKQVAGNHSEQILLPSDLAAGVYYFRVTGSTSTTGSAKMVVTD
ncbi:MAG: T9SS type A sorting domain-containing protein [Bacteroidetes bacterium]|nr:T9SS type A sorting domain-containing protein [Bacteroidota bacterium]